MDSSLISRVRRLISGGVNTLVDAVEGASPETVMGEAVREVDTALEQVLHELGRVAANKHLASTRLMDANAKHEELTGSVQLAVDEDRDDLAEAAISRQLDLEAQVPILEAAIREASQEEDELEGLASALRARKREMEDELAAFRASRESSRETPGLPGRVSAKERAERKVRSAEGAFDRVMRSSTGLSLTGSDDLKTTAQIAELERLTRDNRVRERLATLKASRTADAR